MRNASDVPELQEDDAALGMNGVDNLAPAGDLRFRIDAGHAGAADAGRHTGEASAINSPPGVARWA